MQHYLLLVSICLVFPFVNARWELVFSDNFDKNGGIDRRKWTFHTGGHGWGI